MDIIEAFSDKLTGKKSRPFKIFDESVNPGERASLGLPMPELTNYAPLYMPVKVIHGKTEGPTCLLFATMRGDEFNGMEIIKRVIEMAALKRLHGTIIAVPVLNVFGMLNRSRYLPGDQLLETAFPGSENGHYAARTAHLFLSSLVSQSDLCVQFQCGEMNHRSLPHLYADFNNQTNRQLAEAFPVSVVVDVDPAENTLQRCAQEMGKPMLTYEAGEAMRFNKYAIKQGSLGVSHMLRRIGMLPADSHDRPFKVHEPVISEESEWVYATKSGIAHPFQSLGDRVSKGQALAKITEPLGNFQEVKVSAPSDGIIVGINDMPMVYEGDHLFRIATFNQLDQAATAMDAWEVEEEPPS